MCIQECTRCDAGTDCRPPVIYGSELSSDHSQVPSLTYCMYCFPSPAAGLNSVDGDLTVHKAKNVYYLPLY